MHYNSSIERRLNDNYHHVILDEDRSKKPGEIDAFKFNKRKY